jgi:cytochrome c-type biogenesis protein CcmH
MMLWFVFALMTIAAIFAVLWPLGRMRQRHSAGGETAIYRDQLEEIERDLALGLVKPEEADAARVEVSRRLLAASAAAPAAVRANPVLRRTIAVAAFIILPLFSGILYYRLGTPTLPSFPMAERKADSPKAESLDRLVVKVEAYLEKNPEDGRGWQVLAPALMNLERYDDAVKAYRNAIKFNEESASRYADLGEALMATANGIVSVEAKAEFERAIALETHHPKANYFLGVAAEQDGRLKDAATIWRNLLASAPQDAPWRGAIEMALARVGEDTKSVAPTDQEMAAAANMTAQDRDAMVQAMVDRLAVRLKQDGSDVDGWLRLVKAYMVMGDGSKVQAAAMDARKALAANADGLTRLEAGLKALGVGG